MDSYVEVSFLHTMLLILLSVWIAQYISLKPISDLRLLAYAFLQSLCLCFMWFSYSWLLCVIIEALFFLIIFHYAKKTYLVALCIRALSMATCFVVYQGGFHNVTWFVPIQARIWPVWVTLIIVAIALRMKWKYYLAKTSCVYDTKIYTKHETLRIKGYLDSGNLLTWQGVPVIFLSPNYHAYFKDESIELIVMNSVSDTAILRCYTSKIQIAGCVSHQVYVHCEKNLQLPMGCVALLNMNVMTMG